MEQYPDSLPVDDGSNAVHDGADGIGVDRIRLRFAIDDFDHDRASWNKYLSKNRRSTWLRLAPNCKVLLSVFGEGHAASVDVNPSRVLDPWGFSLCPAARLSEALSEVCSLVGELVTPTQDLNWAEVAELHVARDFTSVPDVAVVLDSLRKVMPPGDARVRLTLSASRGQTVEVYPGPRMRGSKVMLYDKHAQSKGRTSAGLLRFEVQAHEPWLESYSTIRTIDDIDEDSVALLAADRWIWSQMGASFRVPLEFVRQVEREVDGDANRSKVVGTMLRLQAGVEVSRASRTQARRQVPTLGLLWEGRHGPDLGTHAREYRYLDLISGRLEVAEPSVERRLRRLAPLAATANSP